MLFYIGKSKLKHSDAARWGLLQSAEIYPIPLKFSEGSLSAETGLWGDVKLSWLFPPSAFCARPAHLLVARGKK